jgi:hypothetical protein
MVSSVSSSSTPTLTPHQDNQDALIQKQSKARRQSEDRQLQRQDENRQQQIRIEQNRKDADTRAGRTIDIIV